jgi:HSP20 family molecular chaperone IbpA
LVLVESRASENPSVHIRGREVEIDFDRKSDSLAVHLSFDVDVPHSTASFQNGIIEIALRKATEGFDGETEGHLELET